MFLTTTDILPPGHDFLGLVYVSFVAVPVHKAALARHTETVAESSIEWAKQELARRAAGMGAVGVIGIRIESLFGNNCVMLGTAVKSQTEG